jgi:hypothetical protein
MKGERQSFHHHARKDQDVGWVREKKSKFSRYQELASSE